MKVPEATPFIVAPAWVWQLLMSVRAQWRMSRRQLRREAGSALPWPSTAEPEKLMGSPTAQVRVLAGVEIVGTGGLPAVIGIVNVSVAPPVSVTRSCGLKLPVVV